MHFNPSKNMVGNFTDNDGTIDFYLRVNSLVNSDSIVLDLGAGRASWFEDDNCETRKNIRLLKGKVKQVIAADVDPVVLKNKSSDKQIIIKRGKLEVETQSVDLIIADFVLEHIDNPSEFFSQINSCLKKGGWFCARTPHKYSYVSIGASIVGNRIHSNFLKSIQPKRKEIDVFPTRYKMNLKNDIAKTFVDWENRTFIYRSEPSYYFGNKILFNIQNVLHRIFPAFFSGNLFVFVQKK